MALCEKNIFFGAIFFYIGEFVIFPVMSNALAGTVENAEDGDAPAHVRPLADVEV